MTRVSLQGLTPDNFSNLQFWLKADALSLTDGSSVSTWNDSSVNGYNFSAGTAPTYKVNIVNGKPAVLFQSSLHHYLAASGTALSMLNNATGVTMIAVIQQVSQSSLQDLFYALTPSSTVRFRGDINVTKLEIAFRRLDADSSATITSSYTVPSVGTPFIAHIQNDCQLARISMLNNNAPQLSQVSGVANNISNTNAQGIAIAAKASAPTTENFDGYIAEMIVFSKVLSEGERNNIHYYLALKYGISGVVPARTLA